MACEACRRNAAERVLSSATAGHAFELCLECTQRLSQFVLLPEQWLNVASVHTGHVFELHEDFYGLHGESRAWILLRRGGSKTLPGTYSDCLTWSLLGMANSPLMRATS